jgi:predicted kinase
MTIKVGIITEKMINMKVNCTGEQFLPTLVFLIGLPGAGKSTYCTEKYKETSIILSSDDIREQKFGPCHSTEIKNWVLHELISLSVSHLKKGQHVILDTTFFNALPDRIPFMKRINSLEFKVKKCAVIFNIELKECLRRNKSRKRERVVDTIVIEKMSAIMTPPSERELFDELIYISK